MAIDLSKLQSAQGASGPSGSPDFLQGVGLFGKSVLSAAGPELIGLDPLEGVDRFRHRNPALGITSELLGEAASFAVPYVGPVARVSRTLPVFGKLFKAADAATEAGRVVKGSALGVIAPLAPFEAGRVALAATLGEDPAGVAGDAALDLALIGGGAGLIKGFSRAMPFRRQLSSEGRKAQNVFPSEINLNSNPHEQLRKVRELRNLPLDGEKISLLDEYERSLVLHIRGARPLEQFGAKMFRPFEATAGAKRAERLENLVKSKGRLLGRLGSSGIVDDEIRAGLLSRIASAFPHPTLQRSPEEIKRLGPGFEGRWEEFTQYLRVIQPGTEPKAQALLDDFKAVFGGTKGQDLFLAKERQDGLFVFAKKFGGKPGQTSAADEWVVFKTDRPELFAPKSYAGFSRKIGKMAFSPIEMTMREAEKASVPIYPEFNGLMQAIATREFFGESARNAKALGPQVAKALAASGVPELQAVAKELGQAGLNAGRFLKAYVAPTMAQLSGNPRAQSMWGAMNYAFKRAEQLAAEKVYGVPRYAVGKSVIGTLMGKVEREGGLDTVAKTFTKKDLLDANLIYLEHRPIEMLREMMDKGEISPRVFTVFEQLEKESKEFFRRYNLLHGLVDGGKASGDSGHYMLSRSWRGDFRIPLRQINADGSKGDVVWMASGYDKKAAVNQAAAVQKRLAENGIIARWADRDIATVDIVNTESFKAEISRAAQINMESNAFLLARNAVVESLKKANSPAFLKQSKGVGGFLGQDNPMTLKEFRELMQRNIFARERVLSDTMVRLDPLFEQQKRMLARENPELVVQLEQRLDDLGGKSGPVVQLIESYMNKPLEPFLGRNGASKILRATNQAMFHLTLGFGNVAFPLMNAVTTIQTSLPEIAYTLRTPTAALLRDYHVAPLMGKDGKLMGAATVLEPLKILKRSFQEMRGSDPLLRVDIIRAGTEGVTEPRFAEEFVGEKSNLRRLLSGAFGKDSEGFLNGLEALSSYLPARSEVLARGHSFVLGRIVGRDYHGLDGEALYQFAKQFTDRTMFLYSTADRPKIMSGALGGTLGLFKNWTAHYIANFMKYTNEGVQRNNWSPLLWQMAGTWTLAGAGGLPAYSLIDGAQEAFSDAPLIENLYNGFGYRDDIEDAIGPGTTRAAMDGLFYGLPGFAGLSLQGSTAAPGSDIARDASMMFSFALMDRANALSKAFGSAIDAWGATGASPLAQSRIRDQFGRALLPRTLYKAMQVSNDRGLRSLNTGNRLLSDVSAGEGFMFSLGLTPTSLQRGFEASQILWKRQDDLRAKVTELGAAWVDAERSGDTRMFTVIAREAAPLGILDSVLRSAKARRAKMEHDIFQRQLDDARAMATKKALKFD